MIKINKTIKHLLLVGVLLGAVVGIFAWTFIQVVEFLIDVIWHKIPELINISYNAYAFIIYAVGGLLIGLGQKYFGAYPFVIEEVIHEHKKYGRMAYARFWKYIMCALMPLIFGGALGPEAAIVGASAMIITLLFELFNKKELENQMVVHFLAKPVETTEKKSIVHEENSEEISDDVKKKMKKITITSYVLAAIIGSLIFLGLNQIIDKHSFIFKIPSDFFSISELLWVPILAALGFGLAKLYASFDGVITNIYRTFRIDNKIVIKSLVGGILVWAIVMLNPMAQFSGEHDIQNLAATYMSYAVGLLIIMALTKLLATKICINSRWVGGQIFPLIFSGMAISLALASLFGIDPALAVVAFTCALLTIELGAPLLAVIFVGIFVNWPYWIILIIVGVATDKINKKYFQKEVTNV